MGFSANQLSGTDDSNTYWFIINDKEYSINNPAANIGDNYTYQDIIDLVNGEIESDGFKGYIIGDAPDQRYRIYNESVKGFGSTISVESGISGLDLWSSLTGYTPSSISLSVEAEVEIDITTLSDDLGYMYNKAYYGRSFFRGN
jgi:hypothetical protein